MFEVCIMMVSAAMTERAHPGLDSCCIIILIVLRKPQDLCSEVLKGGSLR